MSDDNRDENVGADAPPPSAVVEISIEPAPPVVGGPAPGVVNEADVVSTLVKMMTDVLGSDARFTEQDPTASKLREIASGLSEAAKRRQRRVEVVRLPHRGIRTLSEQASGGMKRKLRPEEAASDVGSESAESGEEEQEAPPSDEEVPALQLSTGSLLHPRQDGDIFVAVSVADQACFTDPAVMDRDLVPVLNRAWNALFGGKTPGDLSRVLTTICLYFATNSTSPRIPPKEKISIVIGGRRVSVYVDRIVNTAYDITGERDVRRVMRAYADFTRDCLRKNAWVRTKMFQEFNLPQNHRSIAFDYSDYCLHPPLSPVEESVLSAARARVLERTSVSDQSQKEYSQNVY